MTVRKDKSPFPWFGGKANAAPLIWEALGDPAHLVVPFAGSLGEVLLRPHPANRAYYSETINDADGYLVNVWRSIQQSPEATAEYASWPVTEADVTARHLWLLRWAHEERNLERLMADVNYYDPRAAGYWLYGICAWIGSGWCSGNGPWVNADGRIAKRTNGEPGVNCQRPHLISNGMGVHHAGTREPGVARKLPHISDNGMGVHHAGTREPGVARKLPHISDNGMGVHRPQLREPGVADMHDWHPMTMPELLEWFRFLSARLRHMRIVNGDWARVMTTGAAHSLPVRKGDGVAGYILDPPYSHTVRAELYNHETSDERNIPASVRVWCLDNGANAKNRIVLCGFASEGHEELEQHGWRCIPWFTDGFLRGGMALQGANGTQQHRERLWLSPHCLPTSVEDAGLPLFAALKQLEDTP